MAIIKHKVRVGLYTTGLKAYWPQFAGMRERLEGYGRFIEGELVAMGKVEVFNFGLVDCSDSGIKAGEYFQRNLCDIVFQHIGTYVTSDAVLPVHQTCKAPTVILNLQPAVQVNYAKTTTGEWLAHCNACPAPEIANAFNRADIPFRVVSGLLGLRETPEISMADETTASRPEAVRAWREIREWVAAASVKAALNRARFGFLGNNYSGMLDMYSDFTMLAAQSGIHVELLEMCDLASRLAAVTDADVTRKLDEIKSMFEISEDSPSDPLARRPTPEQLDWSARVAAAQERLVADFSLDALAYYYHGADGNDYERLQSGFIAGHSLLTAHGIPCAGEGDIKTALAMKVCDLLGLGGSFCEIVTTDYIRGTIIMGHDGPFHLAIAKGCPILRGLGLYHGKRGSGVSVEAKVKSGPVTTLGVAQTGDGRLKFIVSEAEATDDPIMAIGNTQTHVRLATDPDTWYERWLMEAPTHHFAMSVGHNAGLFRKVADLLGFPFVKIAAFVVAAIAILPICAAEYFVSPAGDDSADGSAVNPWRTIGKAARVAVAGDTVTIRGGTYREWVKPANAGREDAPIVYRAADGEKVIVTGADPVTGWTRRSDGLWEANVAYDSCGGLNPFKDFISGDWFVPKKDMRYFRTRLIQNDKPLELFERDKLLFGKVKIPALARGQAVLVPGVASGTIIAAFHDDPNVSVPELIVRPACFYPTETHRDYIHLKGLTFRNAAPDWAPPTSEQMGVVGTHWSCGWIIDGCEISGSCCSGLTLGKFGDEYNSIGGTAENHAASIIRAMSNGVERVGRHIVRRCRISDCDQAGICGAFGGAFSVIQDCDISYCYWQKEYYGAEMGCIKLHCAVDSVIERCRLHHCGFAGIWLDWMAQGAIVRNNVFWHNERDLYLEVNHGPILVEGNDILSDLSFKGCSQGVAFVANRIGGAYRYWNDERVTPICRPHSIFTEGGASSGSGNHVFINNILAYHPKFDKEEYPSRFEDNWMVAPEAWRVDDATGSLALVNVDVRLRPDFKAVDAKRLGKPCFVNQIFPEPSVMHPKNPLTNTLTGENQ